MGKEAATLLFKRVHLPRCAEIYQGGLGEKNAPTLQNERGNRETQRENAVKEAKPSEPTVNRLYFSL